MKLAAATPQLQKRWRLSLTVISLLLFGVALTQTAFVWGGTASASSGPGWRLLLQGWKGGYVDWLANPVLLISWAAAVRGRRLLSMAGACVAATLMLVFMFRRTLELPGPGSTVTIVSHGPGYWLWLGSALLMIAANVHCLKTDSDRAGNGARRRTPRDSP